MSSKRNSSKANKLWDKMMKDPKWRKLAKDSVNNCKKIDKHREDIILFLMSELKNV